MKLRFLVTTVLLTTMGLAPVRPSFSQTDLNAQLNQALCSQNWAQAIDIVAQMKVAAPEYAGELTVYMSQLQALLESKAIFSDWDTGCSPPTTNALPTPRNTSPTTTPGDIAEQPTNVYPPELVEAFLDGCIKTGGAGSKAICNCAIEQIQREFDIGEFLKISGDLLAGGTIPEQLVRIAESCLPSS